MMKGERVVEDEVHGEGRDGSESNPSGPEEDLISPSAVCSSPYEKFESAKTADERNGEGEDDKPAVEMLC